MPAAPATDDLDADQATDAESTSGSAP